MLRLNSGSQTGRKPLGSANAAKTGPRSKAAIKRPGSGVKVATRTRVSAVVVVPTDKPRATSSENASTPAARSSYSNGSVVARTSQSKAPVSRVGSVSQRTSLTNGGRVISRGTALGDGKVRSLAPEQIAYHRFCSKRQCNPHSDITQSLRELKLIAAVDEYDIHELEALEDVLKYVTGLTAVCLTLGQSGSQAKRRSRAKTSTASAPTTALVQNPSENVALLRSISRAIEINTSLAHLELSGIDLATKGLKFLAKAIATSKSLQSLNLSRISLGDAGLKALSTSLSSAQSLVALDLSECSLTSTSIPLITKIIKAHDARRNELLWSLSLREAAPSGVRGQGLILLDLSGNQIDETGAIQLGTTLVNDRWIIGIRLSNNNIPNRGLIAIAELLRTNGSFHIADVRGNPNSDTRLLKFMEDLMLKHRPALLKDLRDLQPSQSFATAELEKWGLNPAWLESDEIGFNGRETETPPIFLSRQGTNGGGVSSMFSSLSLSDTRSVSSISSNRRGSRQQHHDSVSEDKFSEVSDATEDWLTDVTDENRRNNSDADFTKDLSHSSSDVKALLKGMIRGNTPQTDTKRPSRTLKAAKKPQKREDNNLSEAKEPVEEEPDISQAFSGKVAALLLMSCPDIDSCKMLNIFQQPPKCPTEAIAAEMKMLTERVVDLESELEESRHIADILQQENKYLRSQLSSLLAAGLESETQEEGGEMEGLSDDFAHELDLLDQDFLSLTTEQLEGYLQSQQREGESSFLLSNSSISQIQETATAEDTALPASTRDNT